MPKRARYTGAGPVVVTWPPGEVYPEKTWSIEPNHWLPEDAPAALRDHLVANHPDFAGVDQSDSQSSSSGSSSGGSGGAVRGTGAAKQADTSDGDAVTNAPNPGQED
jgi:hypothetical protein